MIDFMCQCDWATGCPEIWSKQIWVCLWCRCFRWVNIWIGRLCKIALPNVGGPHSISWRHELNKKSWSSLNKACLTDLRHWASPALGLKLKHQLFLSLEPLGLQVRIKPMASLGLWLWLSLNASGLVSLHDDMNWFPRANVSLSLFLIYTPYWFCFSGGH